MLKIIDWNVCCIGEPNRKMQYLESVVGEDSFIAILQEVTRKQYDELIKSDYNFCYSLLLREPSKFDTDNRGLGIAIICSKDIQIVRTNILDRAPLPERTMNVVVNYKGNELRIFGMHSVTGSAFKMGKSVQFRTWAESIDRYHPDIVAFDANEPEVDHYQVDKMQFFHQSVKEHGTGAELYFKTLNDIGLTDAFTVNYDQSQYVEGEPLAVSHIIKRGKCNKRYDFIFANNKFEISKCEYYYEDAIKAGSDHALICCECELKEEIENDTEEGSNE